MMNFFKSLSLEGVVAWLFAFSAIAALIMTTWAYVYQTLSRYRKPKVIALSRSEGHFFRRVLPPTDPKPLTPPHQSV